MRDQDGDFICSATTEVIVAFLMADPNLRPRVKKRDGASVTLAFRVRSNRATWGESVEVRLCPSPTGSAMHVRARPISPLDLTSSPARAISRLVEWIQAGTGCAIYLAPFAPTSGESR